MKKMNKVSSIVISILLVFSLVNSVNAAVLLTSHWVINEENNLIVDQGDNAEFLVWITSTTNSIGYTATLYDSSNNLIEIIEDYTGTGYSYYNDELYVDTSVLNGDYYLIIIANDGNGQYVTEYLYLTVNANGGTQNTPPTTPSGSYLEPYEIFVGDTLTAIGQGSYDPDGDVITYEYRFSNQDWSEDNTYFIGSNNAHETIIVDIRAYDGEDYSGIETLTKYVSNSLPVVENQHYVLPQYTSLLFTLTGTDVDEDELTFYLVSGPEYGVVEISPNGEGRYTPNNNYVGDDYFSYRAYDGFDYSNTAYVYVRIDGSGTQNHAPEKPENVYPRDGARGVKLNPYLDWECEDPDGDQLFYTLYFGEDPDNLELVAEHFTDSRYLIEDLDYSTNYYWKVVASDRQFSTEGDVWDFKTRTSGMGGNGDDSEGTYYTEDRIYSACVDDFDGDEFGIRVITLRMINLITGETVFSTIEESCYLGPKELYDYNGTDYFLIILIALIFLFVTLPISFYLYKKLV